MSENETENKEKDSQEENKKEDFKFDSSSEESQKSDDSKQETKPEKILGKFDSQEALEKSYQELEKKLSSLSMTAKDQAEMKKQVANFFSNVKDEASLTEGELADVAKQLHEESGIPRKYIDKFVSVTYNNTTGVKMDKRKAEAIDFLKEGDHQKQIIAAVGDKAELEQLQKRINAGDVSQLELKTLSKVGAEKVGKEANSTFDFGVEKDSAGSDSLLKEYQDLMKNQKVALYDSTNPAHNEVKTKYNLLKQKLGLN